MGGVGRMNDWLIGEIKVDSDVLIELGTYEYISNKLDPRLIKVT
jgi:hypothetical protein